MKTKTKIYLTVVFSTFVYMIFFLYNNYYSPVPYKEILFFLIILLIVNNVITFFCSNINIKNSMILPILFPSIVLFGPFWTAIIAMIGSAEYKSKNEYVWYKFLFNRANIFIAGAMGSLAYILVINHFNTANIILPLFIASIIYIFTNQLLICVILYLTRHEFCPNYYMQIIKNMIFSYFLGLILYYSYIYFGKLLMLLIVVLFYILKDFYNARLKQYNTQKILENKKDELKYIKMKNLFFRNLSHELKTPLNIIYSSAQMIEKQSDNNKTLKYTKLIKENNYRLLRIINNLLDISKIDSKSFKLNYKNIDIVKFIKKLTLSVNDYIKDKDKTIEFKTSLKEKYINVDPVRIERVFLNLISNAIKFTSKGDKITISIWSDKEENYVYISIKDTGIGIKKKEQEMIFKQFQQVDVSLTKNYEGAGLGLAIVKMIVDIHEGEIKLKSKYGKGSTFIIKLPIKKSVSKDNIIERQFDMDRIKMELSDL